MPLKKRQSFGWKPVLLFLSAAPLLSAAETAQAIVIVADSRKFQGVRLLWANFYNESHFHFALMTTLLIPLAGVLLGSLADLVMSRIGINLKSRSLREG
ncbi:MAG: hypothetical protein P4L56_01560 [Candidatus Sulfopaludibacter sp.]|nr:hypothetical protein [Candidatus Sulfopaludibacter sp.]